MATEEPNIWALSKHFIPKRLRFTLLVIKLLCGETTDLSDITTIDATVISHDIALASEESRKRGGELVLL